MSTFWALENFSIDAALGYIDVSKEIREAAIKVLCHNYNASECPQNCLNDDDYEKYVTLLWDYCIDPMVNLKPKYSINTIQKKKKEIADKKYKLLNGMKKRRIKKRKKIN